MDLINLFLERKDYFIQLFFDHVYLSFIAIFIATLIGIVLGTLIAQKRFMAPFVLNFVNIIYTIPSIAMFGMLIAFSGIGKISALIALTLYALLPMVRSTYSGLIHVEHDYIDAAEAMGSKPMIVLFKIRFPLALPVIATGFRNMVVMTIALAGIAAFIGGGGLGEAIFTGITTNNQQLVLISCIIVTLMALVADFFFGVVEKYLTLKSKGEKMKKQSFILPIFIFLTMIIGVLVTTQKQSYDLTIGAKPQTEQYIISEIITQLIENKTDLRVKQTGGIGGGTSNIHPAMLKGDIDMYPEYTGTSWLFVLKESPLNDKDMLYQQLKSDYLEQFNLNWFNRLGFENTYRLMIHKRLADEYQIKTFSDLAPYTNELVFGAEFDFYERDDGFNGLASTYGYQFKQAEHLDIGLKYQAFRENKMDVLLIFTTDPELNNEDYVVLEDDQHYFIAYEAGLVMRQETLDKYPELNQILHLLDDIITDDKMVKMNYLVDVEKVSIKQVASDFIEQEGLK